MSIGQKFDEERADPLHSKVRSIVGCSIQIGRVAAIWLAPHQGSDIQL